MSANDEDTALPDNIFYGIAHEVSDEEPKQESSLTRFTLRSFEQNEADESHAEEPGIFQNLLEAEPASRATTPPDSAEELPLNVSSK